MSNRLCESGCSGTRSMSSRKRIVPLALRAMDREGYYLGLGLANIITLFTPDTVVLGGGVMKSSHLFLPRALQVVRDVCTQVPVRNTLITVAALGSTTGLAGAAQAWFCRHAHS